MAARALIIQKIQVILGSGVGNSFQLQLEVLRIPLHRGVHSHNMRNYILFVLLRQAFLLQVVVGDALQRIAKGNTSLYLVSPGAGSSE